MKAPIHRLALLAVAVVLAVPAPAAAEEPVETVVPPDNSAVNQYTEAFPTAGGNRDVSRPGRRATLSPEKALGDRNAQRLEQQGPDGRAVAELAARTAPSRVVSEEEASAAGSPGSTGGGGPDRAVATPINAPDGPGATGGDDSTEGSSPLSEVVAHASGTSSEQVGVLLPLLLGATALWALAYALRQRRRGIP